MCFSAEISMTAFTIGLGFSILLIQSGTKFKKLMGYFLGYVSLMQFIEYLLWKHPICDNYNKTVSVVGMMLNHLQPIVLAGLTAFFYNKQLPMLSLISVIYLLVIIPYSLQYTSDLQCTTKKCGSTDPHLVWNWNNLKYGDFAYFVFLCAFVGIGLYGMPLSEGIFFSMFAVFTNVASQIFYDRKVVGSLWCFWTAFVPVALYLYT